MNLPNEGDQMYQNQPFGKVKRSAFSEFGHLPYYRNIPKDGRIAFLNPLYDDVNDDWVLLVQTSPDKFQRLKDGEPIQACYMGFHAANPIKDFEFPLGTFVIQHLSFPGVLGALFALETDLHNICAVLEKYLLIANREKVQREGMNLLLRTELEYLISAIRSIYDQLQKLSKHAASLVVNLKEPDKKLIAKLPESFADIVLYGDQFRTVQQIQEKFRLPEPLATFYATETQYFAWLREIRVSIEHHGKTIDTIFDLDEGASINIINKPWSVLPLWNELENIRNNDFGSLHAVFCYLVNQVVEMTTRYSEAFARSVDELPIAVEPGLKMYVRNHFSHHLVSIKETIKFPWERLKA